MMSLIVGKSVWVTAFSLRRNVNALMAASANRDLHIDVWRSFAMFLVYVFHCFFYARYTLSETDFEAFYRQTPLLLKWVWSGDRGVDIFFVISGYLIGCLLFKELKNSGTIDLRRFYYRRILRLMPVYICAIGFYFVIDGHGREYLWANILFVNNFISAENSAMAWCWSLAVEEQFYCLLPLLLICAFKVNAKFYRWLCAAIFVSLIVRACVLLFSPTVAMASSYSIMFDGVVFNQFFDAMYNNLYTRFGELIVGVIGAYIYTNKKVEVRNYLKSRNGFLVKGAAWLLVLTMLMYGGIQFDPQSLLYFDDNQYKNLYLVFNRLVFAVGVLVVLLGCGVENNKIKEPRVKRHTEQSSFSFWGFYARLSYSIYVFHPFVIFGLCQIAYHYYSLNMATSGAFYFFYILPLIVVAFLLSTGLSIVIYLLVEKPFLNMRNMGAGIDALRGDA